MRGSSASARVLMVEDTGLHHAVAPSVTRDETRNTFDEDRLTFGEAGSSSEAKRWHSTVRSREYRRRRKLGPQTRMLSGALKIHQA